MYSKVLPLFASFITVSKVYYVTW